MAQTHDIEFFFDIGSPYSYLAATQIDALGARHSVKVRWRPFLLGAVFKAAENTMPARIPAKARWMIGDLARWARIYGVPFQLASRFPLKTLSTQRALVTASQIAGEEAVPRFALALYHAYWAEDRDVSDREEIQARSQAAGLDGASIVAAIDDPKVKDALRANTEEAVARGAFGAPTIFLGEAMFWGNDRLPLLEEELKG